MYFLLLAEFFKETVFRSCFPNFYTIPNFTPLHLNDFLNEISGRSMLVDAYF